MDALIAADLTWADGALQEGLALRLRAGRIAGMGPLGADRPDRRVHLLMPGATDLQVNGGGGVLFNADPSLAGLAAIRAAHRERGTHAILPTVITDAPEVMEAAADAVIGAWGMPGIAGIHIEGPHIAHERRGTHEARHIRPLDERTLAVLARLRGAGIPVLLTLAPELAEPDLLARAVALGVVLSAGHSSATAAQAERAFALGVTMATHLFNAMPPLHHRDPGLAAAAILSEAYVGLIADGIHVDWTMLRLALAARPRPGRCFLVSDAMPTVGGLDAFTLYGRRIEVREGRLVNGEGALAGAHLDMLTGVARLHLQGGIALEDCIAMATDVPRAAMGLTPLALAPGSSADHIAVLDEGLGFAGWLNSLL